MPVSTTRRELLDAASSPGVRVFAATLLASLAAKGAALQQGFGLDDYSILLSDPRTLPRLLVWQVRTVGAPLVTALQRLQLDSVHAGPVWSAALIASLALLGTLVTRQWRLLGKGWVAYAVAAIVALHPFGCDTLHMRSAIAPAVAMLLLVCLLVYPLRWSPRRIAAGVVVFAVAVATYALALHYVVTFALASMAVDWGRYLAAGALRGWSGGVRRLLRPRRLLRHRSVALLACAAGGTLLHAITATAYMAWSGTDVTTRTTLLSMDRAPERARQVIALLGRHFVGDEPWVSPVVQRLLLLMLAAALGGVALRVAKRPTAPALAAGLAVVAALAASVVASLGIVLVLAEFWPAPRIMAAIALFWAAACALAGRLLPRRATTPLGALVGVVLTAFVGADNRILGEQLRLNRRDAHLANRIAMRLESSPGFSPGQPLAIVGRDFSYAHPFATQHHDTNVSAFAADWARVRVVEEVTGYRFAAPTPEQRRAAEARCAGIAPYPSAQSVAVEGGVAIVCLVGSR